MVLDGQPTQAPWRRIWTTPSGEMATSSTSPPSAWTAGRMRSITVATRRVRSVAGKVGGAVGGFVLVAAIGEV